MSSEAINVDDIRQEIERFHENIVAWFTGSCPDDDATFERLLKARLRDTARYTMPGGVRMTMAELLNGLRDMHGANPEFRISVRDVALVDQSGDLVIADYVEWQKGARASSPQNGRRSTAVFRATGNAEQPLEWVHVQETWLTEAEVAAGPFEEM